MHVTFHCTQCGEKNQADVTSETTSLACAHCGHTWTVPAGAVGPRHVHRCLVCPSTELYIRKDFPQRLGLTIVVLGFVASCIPWYYQRWFATFAILFATALVDVVLYWVTGDLLQCYRCQAQYRGAEQLEDQRPFDLEVHERHRQQLARLRDSGQME